MYDNVNVELMHQLVPNAPAVAGYVNGRWPTYPEVVKRWPNAKHLSVAVTAGADADCLDVERGDATNSQAPAWIKRQLARGVYRPVVYTSASNAAALLATLSRAGIDRSQVRLWSAHYTGKPHICGRATCGYPQADGTQWTDKVNGKSQDESLLSSTFFAAKPSPKPAPKPKPKPVPPPTPQQAKKKGYWVVQVWFDGNHTPKVMNVSSFPLWVLKHPKPRRQGISDFSFHWVETA